MRPISLVKCCINNIIKEKNLAEIFSLLKLQFPSETGNYIISHYPLNYVVLCEKEIKNCPAIFAIWKHIIDKIESNNILLKNIINKPVDELDFDEFQINQPSQCMLYFSKRQTVINALFLEALNKLSYSEGDFSITMKWHDALEYNLPDIDFNSWTLLLSNEINSFNFYPKHAQYLLKHQCLLENIALHALCLKLKFFTKEICSCKFAQLHKVVSMILSKQCTQRVSVSHSITSTQLVMLLKLFIGDSANLMECSKSACQYQDSRENDLWNDALGENDLWNDALGEDINDISVLSNSSSNKRLKCCSNNSYFAINMDVNMYNFFVLSEIKLDLDLCSCAKPIIFNVLPQLYVVKKLAINFVSAMFSSHLPTEFINALVTLLSNPVCKLTVLILSNCVLFNDMLLILLEAFVIFSKNQKFAFERLAFEDCTFDGKLPKYFTLGTNASVSLSSVINSICVKSVSFMTTEAYNLFMKFVLLLHPSVYSILGTCFIREKIASINFTLFSDIFSHVDNVILIPVHTIVLSINSKFTDSEIKKFCNFVSNSNLKVLVIILQNKYHLPSVIKETLHKTVTKTIFINVIDFEYLPLSREDFVSLM